MYLKIVGESLFKHAIFDTPSIGDFELFSFYYDRKVSRSKIKIHFFI